MTQQLDLFPEPTPPPLPPPQGPQTRTKAGQRKPNSRNMRRPLTIEKVHKKYVDCSNGISYNLTAGAIRGDERGATTGRGEIGLYITTIDQSEAYAKQLAMLKRDDDLDRIRCSIVKLSSEQLARVLMIIDEVSNG